MHCTLYRLALCRCTFPGVEDEGEGHKQRPDNSTRRQKAKLYVTACT